MTNQDRLKKQKAWMLFRKVGIAALIGMHFPMEKLLADGPKFSSYQTHSHLRIPLELDSTYKIEKIGAGSKTNGLRIIISNCNSRYGSKDPLGLSGFVDPRTEKISFRSTSNEAVYEITFKKTKNEPDFEYFDYREKSTSELLIDYWADDAKQAQTAKVAVEKRSIASTKLPVLKVPKTKPAAAIAPKTPSCFTSSALNEDNFVPWNLYLKDFDFASKVTLEYPDSNYEYPVPQALSDADELNDNAHYALAVSLYKKNKFGLALKTIDFFEKNFKTSPLAEEVKFLKANTFLKLAKKLNTEKLKSDGLKLVQELSDQGVEPVKSERARIFYFKELAKLGNSGNILDWSLRGAAKNDQYRDLYSFAAGMVLQKVGEYQKAEEQYRLLMEFGSKSPLMKEAAFRIPETQVLRGDYARAITEYNSAIKQFPQFLKDFPNAAFNLGELFFKTKRYAEAKDVFLDFVNRFPYDKNIWAAKIRVAETYQKLDSKSPQSTAKIQKIYQDVINAHPYSAGAYISQIRLSACIEKDSSEALKTFFSEFLNKKNLKELEDPMLQANDLKNFSDFYEIRYLTATENYEKVLPFILEYRDRYKNISYGKVLEKEFQVVVESMMESLFQQSEFQEILKLDERFGDFAQKPRAFGYLNALTWAYYETKDYKRFSEAVAAMGDYLPKVSAHEADQYYVLDYNRQLLFEPDQKKIISTLQKLTDDGKFSDLKYLQLGRIFTEAKALKAAIESDSKLLDGPLASSLSPKNYLTAALRRVKNTFELDDVNAAQQLVDRLLLTHGSRLEFIEELTQAKGLRAKIYFKKEKYAQALIEIEEIEKTLGTSNKKITKISTHELQFMKAKCLDFLNREKEAMEIFRKIASEDKGVWGKSAKIEIEHKDFKSKKIDASKVKL